MKIFLSSVLLLLFSSSANSSLYTIKFEGSPTERQKDKIVMALDLAHEKMRTAEFKNQVINFTQPNGTKNFYQTKRTNEEVLNILLNSPWNHEVSFYSNCLSSARAYVQGSPRINLNWCLIANDHVSAIANTLIHEQSHVLGFTHDFDRTELRPYSVPYGVGSIIEKLTGGKDKIKPLYIPWYKRIFSWFK